jgi:hypothetical protein
MGTSDPGTALANKSEPSVSEMADLRWNLDPHERRLMRQMLAAELDALRSGSAEPKPPEPTADH